MIERGRVLAAIGNCPVCHTADGGRSFAGGRPLETPYGVVFSTNVTPDRETGIGRWSSEDFRRAMQRGVGPEGQRYYPAFPYDHFARAKLADIDAIGAYLATVTPVRAIAPPNRLAFPFNVRPLLAIWQALYLHPSPIEPDPSRDEAWNRGRYLVDAVGHCGACHTPRNAMGAERTDRDLAGGFAEGWHAPALDDTSPAPVRWTVDALTNYLRSGFEPHHGASRGPMAPVTLALAGVPETDVEAMAVYVASRVRAGAPRNSGEQPAMAGASNEQADERTEPAGDDREIAAVYEGACASCHRGQRAVRLEYSTAVTDTSPANIVRVVYDGLAPLPGAPSRSMPGFRGALTQAQAVALIGYVRARFGHRPPWADLEREVAQVANTKADGR